MDYSLHGPFVRDRQARRRAVKFLKRNFASTLGEDLYLLNLADGLERIYFKYRLHCLYEMLGTHHATAATA